MGFNTVVVLLNDFTHEIEESGHVGKRIANAMRSWHGRDRDSLALWFGSGSVISQGHADGEQVVIVSKNSGVRADEATDLGWQALADMKECLERHGYKVTPPKRKTALRKEIGDE